MTTEPTPNIPLLRKAVEWAEAEAVKPEPEREWDQEFWVSPARKRTEQYDQPCGTAYCIAGYVAHITVGIEWDAFTTSAGHSVPVYAQDVLGLTDAEAHHLFDESATIEDVRAVAERIAARAGERL